MFLPAHYECQDKTCGQSCSKGICDGDGRCVSGEENPCAFHGCDGKSCGESCLSGDIMGTCDASGECNFNPKAIHCTGNAAVIDVNLFTLFYDETFEHFITKLHFCSDSDRNGDENGSYGGDTNEEEYGAGNY